MSILDKHDISDYKTRVIIIGAAFAVIFFLIVCRLYYLQIIKGNFYRVFADKNRLKELRIRAPRGVIYDRNGLILADNKPSFDLYLTRGFVKDVPLTLKQLQPILEFTDEDVDTLRKKLKFSPKFSELLLKEDITWDQLARIEALHIELPGISVEIVPVRDYPYGDLFFHAIGFVSSIDKWELEHLDESLRTRYFLRDVIGKKGLERTYESTLKGVDGRDIVVVNAKGEPVEIAGFNIIPPTLKQDTIAGNNLHTTLDLNLQQAARDAFGDQHGAAVMVDVNSGDILAMISRPSFDPHHFNRGIPREVLNELIQNPYKPFLDKTVQEHYPPGSTFKMIMATAALSEGFDGDHKTFSCPGYFRMGRGVWRCWKKNGHGAMALRQAIVQSCDVFFYNVGLFLGLDKISAYARGFGLGHTLGVGINQEIPGFVPSTEWFEQYMKHNSTLEAETINASIGQGADLVTPLQNAFAMSVLANGGRLYKPKLVKRIETPEKVETKSIDSIVMSEIPIKKEVRDFVLDGMTGVVNEPLGTAYWTGRLPDVKIAGKTGTAQVIKMPQEKVPDNKLEWFMKDHAWFIATAPADNPVVAVAVLAEHAGHGSTFAAPIAKAMFKAYFDKDKGEQKKTKDDPKEQTIDVQKPTAQDAGD